jgi:hypothetical protein
MMAKPNNREAREKVDKDYYGENIKKLSLLRKPRKDELSWDYYDGGREKRI